jgi:RNA polymerase sigma factor (TIGR02999 family)
VGHADAETVTRLLGHAAAGDRQAAEDLMPLVYDELHRVAAACFAAERRGHTLQPTALVHEAYMRLVGSEAVEWKSRGQFYFLAATAMRNILVDHARSRGRLKRGGGWARVTVEGLGAPSRGAPVDLAALDDALQRLAARDERKAKLVELRFFGGLSEAQAAELLGVSRTTAADDWRVARAFLKRELKEHADG